MGPRAKLLALGALFALPMVASVVAYNVVQPVNTSNFGELLLPPAAITPTALETPQGGAFAFSELAGRWILIVSDAGACPDTCRDKLTTLRQVRLALGRNASRVERVFVADDGTVPDPRLAEEFAGTLMARAPRAQAISTGATHDRAHIYLVDPRGNVMMRWPAGADRKRMLGDLQRLLKASQIG